MSVPSTRDPQKIPISQVTHEWVEVVRDFQIAAARELKLFAESLSQKGGINVYPAVGVETATVFDEATQSELSHKEVHARACSADHCCQGRLRYSTKSVQFAPIPLPCEQQKCTGESTLAGVRNLVE
jgi:hypothetical protein